MDQKFLIYSKNSGAIKYNYSGEETGALRQCKDEPDFLYLSYGEELHPTPQTHYVDTKTNTIDLRDLTPCTSNVTTLPADGTTELILSQMRDKTHLSIDGPVSIEHDLEGDNASCSLAFVHSGPYTITATAPFPAIPKKFTIEVT